MIIKNNQPVNFDDVVNNPYIDDIKYKQLVQQGDVTQFQFGTIYDNNANNILENPTFSTNLNSWYQTSTEKLFTWNDGVLYYGVQGLTRPASLIRQDVLTLGTKYEVTISINRSQVGYWRVYLGSNKIAELTAGVHTVSGICEASVGFRLQFVPLWISNPRFPPRSIGSVDWVVVTEKTTNNHIFPIVDVEDSTVAHTLRAINDYLSDPYTESSDAQFIRKSLTMSLDWNDKGIPNGCYQIGVCDADVNTNLQCGCFNSDLNGAETLTNGDQYIPSWDISSTGVGGVTLGSGTITLGGGVGAGTASITQSGLKSGVTYDYEFEIISETGTVSLDIKFGTQSDTYTTTGVKTGSITSDGTDLELISTTTTTSGMKIGYVRIQAQSADLEIDYYSNPFYLATTHNRTVVVNCNNTENVFGLNYENAVWTPRLRMRGYVAPDDNAYETEREDSENTIGRRDVFYFKRRKSQLLVIENEPEFIHDWLSLLAGHDHAMVDNKEYFITEGEYPPIKWDYWRVIGNAQLPMQLKQQLERKVVTGDVKIAQFIEDTDGDGIEGGLLDWDAMYEDTDDGQLGRANPSQIIDPSDRNVGIRTPQSTTLDEFEQNNT